MKPLFGIFPVPEAERQDAVVEQVLLFPDVAILPLGRPALPATAATSLLRRARRPL